MAKIRELAVSLGRTANLGNYESGRVDVSASIRLNEDDEVPVEYEKLITYVRNRVDEEAEVLISQAQ